MTAQQQAERLDICIAGVWALVGGLLGAISFWILTFAVLRLG